MLNIKDFHNTAVLCETEQEAKAVLEELHNSGFRWPSGSDLISGDIRWNEYKKETVYYIRISTSCSYPIVTYGHVYNARNNRDIRVVSAKEFLQMKVISPDDFYNAVIKEQ